jgi:hypothetical protein
MVMEVDGQGAVLGTVQRVDGDGRGGTGWCSSRPLLTGVEVSVCHIYIPLRMTLINTVGKEGRNYF